MKIVVLDGYTENPGDLSWKGLEQLGDLTVWDYTEADDIAERIQDAEAVYTNKTPLTRECIMTAEKLRYIGVLATGYNIVDLRAAGERGIPVTNIPTYGTLSVAQYTFALLLEICHHVGHHSQAVALGRWSEQKNFCFWDYPLIELAGKKIGIVGYGRIGRAVAEIARAMGMEVLPYDTGNLNDSMVSLDCLLEQSDVISLHCPLTEENHKMINKSSLEKMKDGVILINTARGGLIDEEALREALVGGKVYAAAVDVVGEEPIHSDNPLLGLDNCLITPHLAWAAKESRQRLMDIAVENLRAFIENRPVNVVNQTAIRSINV